MAEEVILLDFWSSMFGMRVRIALAEKGVEYEFREALSDKGLITENKDRDFSTKSPLLLEMNPVYEKVPVLLHNGKPVSESRIIVEYIDEVWKDKAPLLPADPYQRAQARFWADFVDQKIYVLGRRVWRSRGEEQEAVRKECLASFKALEAELGEKPFLGGDTFGFADVSLAGFIRWFKVYEVYGGVPIEAECPKLIAWAKRCESRPSVLNSIPEEEKLLKFVAYFRSVLGFE